MLEDLHIRAIVHQLLYGLLHGFSKLGVALLDSDALLGHAFDVTQGLKLSVGLGDGITGDRRIGIERIGLARSHCSGRFGLTLVRHHFGLVVGLAAFGDGVGLLFLHGAGLHRDLRATHVGSVELLRIALLHGPRGTRTVVAHEIHGLHTLFGDGHGGDAQIILGANGRNDGVEHGRHDVRLQTKRLGDGLGHVDIIADRSLTVFGIEFSRSVRKLHTGGKLAVLHQIAGRNQLGQLVIFFNSADIVTGGSVRRIRRIAGLGSIGGAASGSGKQHRRAQRKRHNGLDLQRHDTHILLLISSLPYRDLNAIRLQRTSVSQIGTIRAQCYMYVTLRKTYAPAKNHAMKIHRITENPYTKNGRHADSVRMPSVISASQYHRVRYLPYV